MQQRDSVTFDTSANNESRKARSETLSFETKLAFVAQAFPAAAIGLTIAVFLPKFYTDVVLIPAGLLAVAIAIARAFDAVIDPLMGFVSDHTHTRWGRRKPWIALGVAANTLVFYLLLSPPERTGPGMLGWFVTCFILSFLFVTMVQIPRTALAAELTLDGKERSSLFGMIALFLAMGLIGGAIMPGFLEGFGIADPRDRMTTVAVLLLIGYVLTNWWFLYEIKERPDFLRRGTNPFVPGVRRAFRSRPFRIMFISHIITAIPFAIPATLMPYYVEYVMKSEHATKWTGFLLLAYLLSGFLALPFWVWLSGRIGRLKVWLIVSFIGVSGGFLWFFIGPGDEKLALLLQLYVGMQAGAWYFLGGAMHADIIDYDELLTGRRREAQYSAYWTIIPKFALILGASLPLAILSAVGYTPNTQQSPGVVMAIRILFALVPAGFNALGLSIMYFYPLQELEHAQIREGILRHARGEPALDPITGLELLPPAERLIPEAVGWRLDYFSRGELRRAHAHGVGSLILEVTASMLTSAAVCSGAAAFAVHWNRSQKDDPGVIVALTVVLAGLAFAGFFFHALRLRPAFGMWQAGFDPADVRAHLEELERHARGQSTRALPASRLPEQR